MKPTFPHPGDQGLGKASDLSYDLIAPALRRQRGVIGDPLLLFDLVDSTNTAAHRLADAGYPEGTVVIANGQTSGRGRQGRRWFSPPDRNIYMSVILRPPLDSRKAALLTLIAAIACCRTLRDHTCIPASIKWPNDIVVGKRKCGGILAEMRLAAGSVQSVVLGIGLNVNTVEGDFDEALAGDATSIRMETSRAWERSAVAARMVSELDRCYRSLLEGGAARIRSELRDLSSTIGQFVRVTADCGIVEGVAVDIDEEGCLVLELPDCSIRRVYAGDLSHLRAVREKG